MVKRGGKMAILSKKKKTKKQKIKKVVNKAEHTQIDFEKQHQNALEQSVVLVGPSDVGKSVLGRHFAKKYGLVYIDMQEILRCRKSIDRIQADIDFYKVCSRQTKKECRNSLARRYAAYTRIERQNLEFRLNFPNVSNLEEMFNLVDSLNGGNGLKMEEENQVQVEIEEQNENENEKERD